jgi:hypothetical protein
VIGNGTNTTAAASVKASSKGLPAGAIAGIVIGVLVLFSSLGAAGFFFWRKRQQTAKTASESSSSAMVEQGEEKTHEYFKHVVSPIDTIGSPGGFKEKFDGGAFKPIELESGQHEFVSVEMPAEEVHLNTAELGCDEVRR